VAQQFYDVGMTPLNDLLKAQVEVANARQELIEAQNDLDVAEANFNTLLRRPVTEPVKIEEILQYAGFKKSLQECLETAEANRLELQQADLQVDLAEKDVEIAKKDFYPSVNLNWTYYQEGTDWDAKGGAGLYSDSSGWNVKAVASWDLWQWGRTHYGVKERLSRLKQARHRKAEVLDRIHLEVTEAFLKTVESEKAIVTAEKAIEQARENFRITQERYKAQMAISLEVFDAQTLLSRAMTNYYSALYFFKIAKASLYRAMGREILE
jgi:outer membrane protein TolC